MAKRYKKGDRVAVLNTTYSGRVFVECERAIVVRDYGDGQCDVRIEGEGVFARFVDPAAQADPHAFATQLNEQLQAARA
jgi:hypothetical protein